MTTGAAITNRTIDDTVGDLVTGVKPTYLPYAWQTPACGGCAVKPPLDDVFLGTYSALTYMQENFPSMSIQFSFKGTAIYVYFILANNVAPQVTTETLANFTLDGQLVSTFNHIPSNSPDYQFNSLVFSKDGLSNVQHTLSISTTGNRHLYTNFDYAHYTFVHTLTFLQAQFDDTPVSSSSSTSSTSPTTTSPTTTATPPTKAQPVPVGAIAGGVIGGVLLLLVALLIFLCLRRRKQRIIPSTYAEGTDEAFSIDGFSSTTGPSTPFLHPTQGFVATSIPPRARPETLPPPYSDNGTLDEETRSESMARLRQAQIDRQIRSLTTEMQMLAGVDPPKDRPVRIRPSLSFSRSRRETNEMSQMQQQVDTMRAEIDYLQAQLQSDWARGLSNEPPPSYSVASGALLDQVPPHLSPPGRVAAVATNRTIDDTYGDSVTGSQPIYLPVGNWDDASCSPSHCTVLPPSGQAFDHSYHAATYLVNGGPRTAQLSFRGTAIYVFFILANNVPNAGTETFCNFILDGQNSGPTVHHAPTSSTNYQYNALVFSKTNLANIDHTLLISADSFDTLSYVNFDYAIYTHDDGVIPTNPTSNPDPTTSHPTAPVVTDPPRTVTTIISGQPVVTQINSPASTQSESGSTSSPPPPSSPLPSPAENTSATAGTTKTTLGPQASSSSGPSGSSTADNSSNSNKNAAAPHKTPVGAIAGGVAGGVVVLLLILLLLFCRRRRRSHTEIPSTQPEPFTASASDPDIETRAVDSAALLIPSRKQREIQEGARNMHTPSASMSSSSEALRTQRQSMIANQIVGLTKGLGGSGSSASGSSREGGSDVTEIMEQNQAMKAEIERLQAQLNSDWALGLTNEPPPGYSRGSDNFHHVPVPVFVS
ncbi:hypothetical protein DXG01_012108 [Tephrocybe rancida]|nr:hypothetical protein DXG01_012108 [Tephrocybe rancida]